MEASICAARGGCGGRGGNPLCCRLPRQQFLSRWGQSWHGGPPFRVKPPVALLVNLSIHPGARAQSGTERETSSVPSWPGLLPPSDPEGLERVGRLGRQAEPTAKAEERKQPSYFTHFAERKQRL